MKTTTKWVLGGGAVLGVIGWVQLRLYIRREVERVLREDYEFDTMLQKNPLYKAAASYLNVPDSSELAQSVVPIWSPVTPYAAIDDILLNGRDSVYWPSQRKKSSAPKWVDDLIFSTLRRMSEEEEKKEVKKIEIKPRKKVWDRVG
jgi:hypothetical protein